MSDLATALRRAGLADVDDSSLAKALYSSDASLYRVPPAVVVRPQHVDELDAVLAVSRETGTPVTMRGAGTSIAGNAVGTGMVVDTLRHLNRIVSIDVEARTATVEPGVVHAQLQRALAGTGLRFGPDPSTHTRCTIGGMIGNNACGSRALAYGRTADNVLALETTAPSGAANQLAGLVDSHLAVIRTEFGRFSRQGSGYSLEHLLPEKGRSLDRLLVGSEGTLAVVRRATLRLVEEAAHRVLVVLGYGSMAEAADAVQLLLAHDLVACEGLDERIVRAAHRPGSVRPDLPEGNGWILAEVTGASAAEALAKAQAVLRQGAGRVVADAGEQAALWRIREDGAGLAARTTSPPGQAGWEDAAVPPERLGAYLRDFEALLRQHGYDGAPYGHFGDGCLHIRIDFVLDTPAGRSRYRRFVLDAAHLAASYGGSLSGEHGDGRARSELLPTMYGAEALALMASVKGVFDPDNLLNPGVLVEPRPFDADLRLALPVTEQSFSDEFHRCTGVGKCLADNTSSGGVMCPSYLATREEKDSTRGRARVLQEMLTGQLVRSWDATELEQALDLCLACRGCARDCPTGVDMATYKMQALARKYAGKRRPRSHYTLGRLPALARASSPGLANAGLRLAALAKAVAGIDRRRALPTLAKASAKQLLSRRGDLPGEPDVVLFLDTFTDRFSPQVAVAAVEVLEGAGQRVSIAGGDSCCGLTWLTTGQLDRGTEHLGRLVAELERYDAPVVVLEPSCLTVLRGDAPHLLQRTVTARTLAEQLESLGFEPPDLTGVEVVAQPHCHHTSVLGWQADERLLRASGATVTRVGGCCGMAGNFGMEKGHYEVSVAIAEHSLLPAVRAAGDGAVVLADGFSCRTQLADLAGVAALHLAQLLDFDPGMASR